MIDGMTIKPENLSENMKLLQNQANISKRDSVQSQRDSKYSNQKLKNGVEGSVEGDAKELEFITFQDKNGIKYFFLKLTYLFK